MAVAQTKHKPHGRREVPKVKNRDLVNTSK
jgi:hypothetical protein